MKSDNFFKITVGQLCVDVRYEESKKGYGVRILDIKTGDVSTLHGKHLVIGMGTKPTVPACVQGLQHPAVFHASDYLFKKDRLAKKEHITIIGSGQSAAEVFHDLLTNGNVHKLSWFTRSSRFYPMETTQLTLELSSPDYIDYFYHLDPVTRSLLVRQQDSLYKGITAGLIAEIYDTLYARSLDQPLLPHQLIAHCELQQVQVEASGELRLELLELNQQRRFSQATQALILATGYQPTVPTFLEPLRDHILWPPDDGYTISRQYTVDENHTIFVQNADLTATVLIAPI